MFWLLWLVVGFLLSFSGNQFLIFAGYICLIVGIGKLILLFLFGKGKSKKCSECGSVIVASDKFCRHCGSKKH